jgi:hypothetical protein
LFRVTIEVGDLEAATQLYAEVVSPFATVVLTPPPRRGSELHQSEPLRRRTRKATSPGNTGSQYVMSR